MRKIGINKLDNLQEVDFTVLSDLPDCRRISANKTITEGVGTYDRYKIPVNQFECMAQGCVNSGTLYTGGTAVVYHENYESIEFSSGVITFYVIAPQGASATVKVSEKDTFANADSYTINLDNIPTGKDGFKAVVVDLAKAPTATVGNGWTPSRAGAYISIAVTGGQGVDLAGVGISSIAVFDTIDDFEINTVVKIGCLTGIDGSWDLDAAEATCFGNAGYATDDIGNPEKTITGKALSPNYMILNPFYGKGKATTGFDIVTIEKVVEPSKATDVDAQNASAAAGDYGVITISDLDQNECGFVKIMRSLEDNCIVTDGQLERWSIPSLKDMDEGHYVVVPNDDGSTTIYFNKAQIGATMTISYPQTVDVDEFVFDEDNINTKRVRLSYVKTYTDKTKWRFVFDNVLVTSFPDGITEEETELEFTVVFQKDANGQYGRAYRILG